MNKKEIEKQIEDNILNCFNDAREYLQPFNLDISLDDEYDFNGKPWVAVYEGGSVFSGTIEIGINKSKILKWAIGLSKQNHSDFFILDNVEAQVFISVFHEIGHALIDWMMDYFNEVEDVRGFLENNKYFQRFANSDEEKTVEKFGETFSSITGVSSEDSDLRLCLDSLNKYIDNSLNESINDDSVKKLLLYHCVGNGEVANIDDLIKSVFENGLKCNDNGERGEGIWLSTKPFYERSLFVVSIEYNSTTSRLFDIDYDGYEGAFARKNIPFEYLTVETIPVAIRYNKYITNKSICSVYNRSNRLIFSESLNKTNDDTIIYKDLFEKYCQPYLNERDVLSKIDNTSVKIKNFFNINEERRFLTENSDKPKKLYHCVGGRFGTLDKVIPMVIKDGLKMYNNGEIGDVIWLSSRPYYPDAIFIVSIDFTPENQERFEIYFNGYDNAYAHKDIPAEYLNVEKIPVLQVGSSCETNDDIIEWYNERNGESFIKDMNDMGLETEIFDDAFEKYCQPYMKEKNILANIHNDNVKHVNILG